MRVVLAVVGIVLGAMVTGPAQAETGKPRPFTVHVPDAVLADLRDRLENTRWPDQIKGSGWDYGTDTAYLKELVDYWAGDFDWRAQEERINAFDNYKVEIDGIDIHYIYEKGKKPDSIPLLMMHGWPSSFVQFLDIIPLLTDPAAHGAPDAPSFDVVVVSHPGYGFSEIPAVRGFGVTEFAPRMHQLMTDVLGYDRYAVRGSDVGNLVIQQLGLAHPEALIGAHVTGLLRGVPLEGDAPRTPEEEKFFQDLETWVNTELSYARQHASKPQTLAHALNDSPAGLASWIIEKFWRWADTGGDIESRFTKDELLTNLTVYWVTQTINSSIRLYYEFSRDRGLSGVSTVPTAVLMAEHDMVPVPRVVSERMYNLKRYTWSESGGHFLEWEEPDLVARDMRAFFATLQ